MRVLIVEPQKPPFVSEIEDSLKAMQGIVGGCIEAVYLEDGICLFCNEEGKIDGLPLNRSIGSDIICGTFFICGQDDEGDSISLTDEQIKQYTDRFAEPEQFLFSFTEKDLSVSVIGFSGGYDYNDTYGDEEDLEP